MTSTPIERESETAPTIAWIERSASVPMKPLDSDDFLMSSGTTTSKCASIFGPILTKSSLKQITAFFESVERSESANSFSSSSVGWSCAERVDDASWGLRAVLEGRRMALRLFDSFEPSAVVGFGGYPSLPAILAATSAGVPTVVHEQNAVLGRVNRLFAGRVDAIATAYPEVERLASKHADKVHLVGNPVRAGVLSLRDEPFPTLGEEGLLRVLVTGGSQGARVLSEVVPDGLSMLPPALRPLMPTAAVIFTVMSRLPQARCCLVGQRKFLEGVYLLCRASRGGAHYSATGTRESLFHVFVVSHNNVGCSRGPTMESCLRSSAPTSPSSTKKHALRPQRVAASSCASGAPALARAAAA